MKKLNCAPLVLFLVILLAGCSFQSAVREDTVEDKTPSVPAPEWSILLTGTHNFTLESSCFAEAKIHASHFVEMELEKEGSVKTYGGIPLYMLAAVVDGPDTEHSYTFDRSLWKSGYDITVTAKNGYSITLNTADIEPGTMILADTVDGKPVSPIIVGRVPADLWAADVVEIELGLESSLSMEEAGGKEFKLIMDINGIISSFTIEELEASPYYIEEKGRYTTSAGTTYSGLYGGIKFADFLNQFMNLTSDDTITMAALDGYEMTYSGKQVLDKSDGEWILGFKLDGEYLPEDPGYIRTIKVGPDNPNIDGHLSVKMIETIIVKEDNYRDFSIKIQGKIDLTIDRQTIQSGISCHKKRVHFERKGKSAHYTGIPLYLILAFSDDPDYAPHKQDSSILSYNKKAAQKGYTVEISAADGYKITLDSRELDGNADIILAMYKENEELPDNEFPLILVWDKDAERIPEGIKPIKQITGIRLIF